MHRRGPGAAGLIGFYLTPRCVFYGFTVRLVGAPFFFARKKNVWERGLPAMNDDAVCLSDRGV
jgi:hypothetical protein